MPESGSVLPDKTVLGTIRAQLDSLAPGNGRVAQAVLDAPQEIIHLPVAELAGRAGVVESTVVRTCRKLGYSGYQDLKIRLARELGHFPQVRNTIDADATPYDTLRTVLAFEAEVLQDITSGIDQEHFEAAVQAVAAAGRVVLVGFGSSYNVCTEACERLSSVGVDAAAPSSSNMKLLQVSRLTPDDVLICVSQTGATLDILRYAEVAGRRGATVIGLTGFGGTRLIQLADIRLVAGGRDLDHGFGAISGRMAHLAVLDSIYMCLPSLLGERATTSLSIFHDEEATWRIRENDADPHRS